MVYYSSKLVSLCLSKESCIIPGDNFYKSSSSNLFLSDMIDTSPNKSILYSPESVFMRLNVCKIET